MKTIQFVSALVLLATSSVAMAAPAPKYAADISQMERAAWRIACAFKAYDCTQLAAPQVWYTDMAGAHGRYWRGAPGIEINVQLLGQSFSGLVMVHEMVHYIQQAQINASPMHGYTSHCARESEAFNITNAAAYAMGFNDARLSSWPEMAAAYGCSFSLSMRPLPNTHR